MMMQDFSEILKVLLQISQVIALIYAGYKFTRKPHDTLEEKHNNLEKRVDAHDVSIKEIKSEMNQSFERHREQDKTNKVFKRVFLLLANFEVTYCQETGFEHTADLVQAKKELEEYLTGES